jgi:hypothetical protein
VDNNYLDLGMNKSGFVHTLPSGRLSVVGGIVGHLTTALSNASAHMRAATMDVCCGFHAERPQIDKKTSWTVLGRRRDR